MTALLLPWPSLCICVTIFCPSGFLEGVKAKREKLFGFGHRVYKNFDPRAKIIRGVSAWGHV
jgi:hypothetical protein